MPGVTITTTATSGPASDARDAAAQYFVAGQAERGRTDAAVLIRSLADYVREFGARVAYGTLYDDLRTYFEEGGVRAYVARVIGDAATLGTVTLKDRDADPGVSTLRIDAANAGAWSAQVTVAVSDGSAADTFTLTVTVADPVPRVVETWADLTSPADAATKLERSRWIRGTDLGSATAAPDDNPRNGSFVLAAGTDDRASIVAADYVAALGRFTGELGTGAVAIPGQPVDTVGAGLRAHAVAEHRVALSAFAPGTSIEDATTEAVDAVAGITDGEYMAIVYPAIVIPAETVGLTRTITPEGYAAAARCRAVVTEGVWRAPAGEIAAARFVVGTDVDVDRTDGDALDALRVSTIRRIAGGPRLYGWRSLSADEVNYRLLTSRDLLNVLLVAAAELLEAFVFRTIDGTGRALAQMNAELTGLVEPYAAAGGLYPSGDDPGYRVDTGAGVNPPEQLAAGRLAAVLSARPSPTAELIDLTIVKAGPTAAV